MKQLIFFALMISVMACGKKEPEITNESDIGNPILSSTDTSGIRYYNSSAVDAGIIIDQEWIKDVHDYVAIHNLEIKNRLLEQRLDSLIKAIK